MKAVWDDVLDRLGLANRPDPDRAGLERVYLAWCRNVPFDNVVKRIHLASGDEAPIPNGPVDAFYASFLAHGTGGTCWPSSNALYALVRELGFDARRGSAAMADLTAGPIHSHGTVLVRIDGAEYWVDSSMLTDRPLPVRKGEATTIDDPINPVRAEPVEDMWRVFWRFPIADGELPCLLLDGDVDEAHYLARYEWSRENSPFNTAVYATRNFDGRKLTVAFGQRFERTADGLTTTQLDGRSERDKVLIEELGYSEEIVAALPSDQ
jgi:N-hydroxyarylamine O-acetyltransferase